jgi:hypothetical protein
MAVISLSQHSLQTWQTCRRKYKHLFIDELTYPLDLERQQRLELGKQFHLLVQQERLGLDISTIVEYPEQITNWLSNYHQHPPTLIQGKEYPEYQLNYRMGDYLFSVVYDLLVLGTSNAQIVDWKTYQNPPSIDTLKRQWQTRLYLYILKNTSHYACQEITITYWFASRPSHPLTIAYDPHQHQQTHQELLKITAAITSDQTYPLRSTDPDHPTCQNCEFKLHCHDRSQPIDLDRIPELPLIL